MCPYHTCPRDSASTHVSYFHNHDPLSTDVQLEVDSSGWCFHNQLNINIMRAPFKSGDYRGVRPVSKWHTLCHLVLYTVQQRECERVLVYALVKSRCYERPRQSRLRIRDLFLCVCVCLCVHMRQRDCVPHSSGFRCALSESNFFNDIC